MLMFLLFCMVNYLLCFSADETRFISFEFLLQVSIAILCQMGKERDDGVGGREKRRWGENNDYSADLFQWLLCVETTAIQILYLFCNYL